MSITKNGRLIGCFLIMAALSCNQKPKKSKQVMVAPDRSVRTVNVDGKTFHAITKALPNLSNQSLAYWDNYFPAYADKIKYLPYDSLMPGIYQVADFSNRLAYSVSWGSVDERETRESVGALKFKNGKSGRTPRWTSVIKGQLFFPDRGVLLAIEIPFSYQYNFKTGAYEYFSSMQNGSTCSLAITGPALGELSFPLREVYNFSSKENMPDGYNGWAEGDIMITERRDWLEFSNKSMKFLYGPVPVVKQAISDALTEHNIKTIARTSELYNIKLTIRFRSPAKLTVEELANRDHHRTPLYILTLSGEFLGIHHN